MKKALFILLTITQLSCNSHAQEEIEFDLRFTPETVYIQTIEQTSSQEVYYSGTDEFLQNLKDKGIENPTKTNESSIMGTVIITEKMKDQKIPMKIEFVNTPNETLPNGTVIYGFSTPDRNMPILDSVVSEGMNEESRLMLLSGLQNVFEQVSLPNIRLKVGESFSHESPLSIPIADVTIDMTILTVYKLTSIKNDIANLDVSQVYTLTSSFDQYSINATGSGSGNMIYLISKNYFSEYQMDIEIEMNLEVENMKLDLKSKSSFLQSLEIESKNAKR